MNLRQKRVKFIQLRGEINKVPLNPILIFLKRIHVSHNKYCFSETFRCGSRKLLKNSILGEVVIVKKFNIKKFNIKHYEVKVSLILFAVGLGLGSS